MSDHSYVTETTRLPRTKRMQDEEAYIRLQDRSLELIEAQLLADIDDLTIDELLAVDDFLEHIGGPENAQLALALLKRIDRAA